VRLQRLLSNPVGWCYALDTSSAELPLVAACSRGGSRRYPWMLTALLPRHKAELAALDGAVLCRRAQQTSASCNLVQQQPHSSRRHSVRGLSVLSLPIHLHQLQAASPRPAQGAAEAGRPCPYKWPMVATVVWLDGFMTGRNDRLVVTFGLDKASMCLLSGNWRCPCVYCHLDSLVASGQRLVDRFTCVVKPVEPLMVRRDPAQLRTSGSLQSRRSCLARWISTGAGVDPNDVAALWHRLSKVRERSLLLCGSSGFSAQGVIRCRDRRFHASATQPEQQHFRPEG